MAKTHTSQENYETCTCHYFTSSSCSSCPLLGLPQGKRLPGKVELVREVFSRFGLPIDGLHTEIITPSHPWGSRNKAKLSVTGSIAAPTIGMVRSDLSSVDLRNCPLMAPACENFYLELPRFIEMAGLIPYDIEARTGELKGVHLIVNHKNSEGIVRFVLRSSEAIPRTRKIVGAIQAQHPWAKVISCNIQPLPAAILEGPEEALLTSERFIQESYGPIKLLFAPSSFIQVTQEVAEQLYLAAADFARRGNFTEVLDLFCGVGGFSYSVAPFVKHVTGVELSSTAIESARTAAALNNTTNINFFSADSEDFLNHNSSLSADLVIVNPPRRGLSPAIVARIIELAPRSILYSSCNPETFARDVHAFIRSGRFTFEGARLFDMFPLTHHCEVLGTLAAAAGTR